MYYFDTCIWLNIFKKEKKFFKDSLRVLKKIEKENSSILVSTIILKEIYFKYESFNEIKTFFKSHDLIQIIKTTNKDYDQARQYEKDNNSKISFYDYLHVAICRRLNLILITRDKDLLNFSKTKIITKSPSQLIS
ncbi:MAG: PIN domain-containing protein [Nanoarchaeota archaeon]|jgi:predicted nucleic acid-binding protein|nr:PIN domain-containing protein [Nanoarchaeota archaeon]